MHSIWTMASEFGYIYSIFFAEVKQQGQMRVMISCIFVLAAVAAACVDNIRVVLATHAVNKIAN